MGLFQLINPVIKYHPGKANIIANALSRSQRSVVEPEKTEEKEVAGSLFTLTTRMEMDQEERYKWVNAYETDPHLRVALQKLQQGQRVDDYLLTPSGLIGIRKHGQVKIVVPASLRQGILRECHDSPTAGHVGMRRTLEQVDRKSVV